MRQCLRLRAQNYSTIMTMFWILQASWNEYNPLGFPIQIFFQFSVCEIHWYYYILWEFFGHVYSAFRIFILFVSLLQVVTHCPCLQSAGIKDPLWWTWCSKEKSTFLLVRKNRTTVKQYDRIPKGLWIWAIIQMRTERKEAEFTQWKTYKKRENTIFNLGWMAAR